MKNSNAALLVMIMAGCAFAEPAKSAMGIVIPADAPANIQLAAKELRRYVFLGTFHLSEKGK